MGRIYSGAYLNFEEEDGWEYVTRNHKGAVVIVPVLEEINSQVGTKHIVLIAEYRKPFDRKIIGLPAGLVGDVSVEESIYNAAIRELEEETGYRARTISLAAENVPSSSGMTDETFSLFIARDLEKVSNGGGTESEDIDTLVYNIEEIPKLVVECRKKNILMDPKIFMGLWFLENWDEIKS